ncbi:pregnancy-associated plasma protein-A [Murinocardiopsis flavida]|uniref:Pregnancy-associated plasma protein-A n=1 Tax=Murinocardiopsis flavida TaxID=645275 RepID=A0A2P8CMS4_9ACTN|nr:zinc metalloprotease [Murinocardiopsis flavida]PSK86274.1 pregnancy-associated plasma protein-A [Murinocardiopsis flavida]
MVNRLHTRVSRNVGTWSGLAFGAVALAGLASGLAAPPEAAPARPAVHAAPNECPPTDGGTASGARLGTPGVHDPSTITPEEAAELDRMLDAATVTQSAPDARNPQTVPVVMHVISAKDGTGKISDAVVKRQIDVMNKGFSGGYKGVDTGFRFTLKDVTHSVDDTWFRDFSGNEDAAKRELRKGGAETLNLYSTDMGQGILGRSTFPQDYKDAPETDGVVIDYRSVPGGGRAKFDLGFTAVHETGHWLGLFHTFQNGCASPGDYVDDTPAEREQAAGCPEGRDTCPDDPGADPVHNFMNYSDDKCLNQFTAGQAERMGRTWSAFRG